MQKSLSLSVIAATILALLMGIAIWFAFKSAPEDFSRITSFEECAAAGNPVMESYPRQCRSQDGQLFVEDISNENPVEHPRIMDPRLGDGCVAAGCSGVLCVSPEESDTVTTCEYRAEYACYDNAKCEKQTNGKCGWTMSSTLTACLNNPPSLQ
jgi:hypothetical protein